MRLRVVLVAVVSLLCWPLLAGFGLRAEDIAKIYFPRHELRCLGYTQPHGKFDKGRFLSQVCDYGYNTVIVSGTDDSFTALYPSREFPFAAYRGYAHDTLKSIIDGCHKQGVRVLAYCPYSMSTTERKFADGLATTEMGNPLTGKPEQHFWASIDSPEFRKKMVAACKELAALGVDGYWIDGFSLENQILLGAKNQYSDSLFKQQTGWDAPKKANWESESFRRWVVWRYRHHLDNGRAMVQEVRAAYPNVHFSFNTHTITPTVTLPDAKESYAPLSWNRWYEGVPLWRFPDEIGASNHAKLSPSNVAQQIPFWTQLESDCNPLRTDTWQPNFCERYSIGNHLTWGNSTPIPGDELGLTLSALGAFMNRSQIWIEGQFMYGRSAPEPEMYRRINDAIKAREEYFGGDKLKYVGVLLSNNTRDFWGLRQQRDNDPRNTDRQFVEGYFGLVSMLMSDHIVFEHIYDNMIDAKTLDQFAVIVLANAACLSEAACAELAAYAERGGRLIADYESSLYDEWGERRADFGLAKTFGVTYRETLDKVAYEPHTWTRELADNRTSLNDGGKKFVWQTRRTLVAPTPGIEVVACETGNVHSPDKKKSFEFKGDPFAVPAIVCNVVGKGEAVYLCDYLGQGYYQSPFRSQRVVLRNLIGRSPSPVTVRAPSQILTRAYRQHDGNRVVVHLLNLPPMSTRLFERGQMDTLDEVNPAHNITVTLAHGRAISASLVPAGRTLPIQITADGGQQVFIPEVAKHEMVVFAMQ